jgi:hypothetical protein
MTKARASHVMSADVPLLVHGLVIHGQFTIAWNVKRQCVFAAFATSSFASGVLNFDDSAKKATTATLPIFKKEGLFFWKKK